MRVYKVTTLTKELARTFRSFETSQTVKNVVLPLSTYSHWGQGVVFWSSTSQIHCKDMDKVPTLFPAGSPQLHLKCSLPVYSQFTHPVIFRDILNVFRAYHTCITSSTPWISMQCAHLGHHNPISLVHLKIPNHSFPYLCPQSVNWHHI